jgi:hypothetical protein
VTTAFYDYRTTTTARSQELLSRPRLPRIAAAMCADPRRLWLLSVTGFPSAVVLGRAEFTAAACDMAWPARLVPYMRRTTLSAACAGVGAFGSSYLPAVGYGYFEMCRVLYRACYAVERLLCRVS